MERAFCNVSVAPVRAEGAHQSEMVSQMLYGETAQITEQNGSFFRIMMDFDGYEGWMHRNQLTVISDETFNNRKTSLITDVFKYTETPEGKMLLSAGSEVETDLADQNLNSNLAETARLFLNVPYLWSGRSFFGIDCSGFTQLVHKLHDIKLPRDAYQQAEHGVVLDFIEEAEPGDLAFFEDFEGKIVHVGIMLEEQKIIHAYGKVRIDQLDSSGIYNPELRKHSHKLRFVKTLR